MLRKLRPLQRYSGNVWVPLIGLGISKDKHKRHNYQLKAMWKSVEYFISVSSALQFMIHVEFEGFYYIFPFIKLPSTNLFLLSLVFFMLAPI